MEFVDNEAVLSDNSYESDDGDNDNDNEEFRKPKKLKKSKPKKTRESDDDDEDDEDEDDGEAVADLINDEEEEESEDEIGRGRKRSHDEEYNEDLEDDDYDLIEENLGTKIERKKKFRRVVRLEEDDDDDGGRENNIMERDAIANELFEDDDHRFIHQEPVDDQYGAIDSEHSEEDDDVDDFIVGDDGQPLQSKPRTKKGRNFNDQAIQRAQDIFGVDFDYDMFDENDDNEDEELEEDGYDEDGLEERVRDGVKKKRQRVPKKSIFELYEPAELERSHLTEADNEIRNTDLPERFQLRNTPVTRADMSEINKEAEWIYKILYESPSITKQDNNSGMRQPLGGIKPRSILSNMTALLGFIRNDLLEVPFIAYYRKEYYFPELSINDLWLIYRWDEKWCQLQERKRNLQKLLENMKEYQLSLMLKNQDQPLPDDFRRITEKDIKRAQSIQSFEEFNDCYLQFQLYYLQDLAEMKKFLLEQKRQAKERKKLRKEQERLEQGGGDSIDAEAEAETENPDEPNEEDIEEYELSERLQFLRLSIKRDTYTICKEFGIGKLAAKFGLTPEQFGEHLSEGYHKHEIEQQPQDPMEIAQEFVSKRFDTNEKVLQAATFMVGKQLSCDPLVRKTVRQMFYERATVTVRPTKKGKKEIDESHPCYQIKYLKNKPISSFTGDQFLKLNMAKTDGLVDIQIEVDESFANKQSLVRYLDEIKYLYQKDEFSKNVQNWNEQRAKALEIALNRFLYPYLIKELTAKVLTEAQFTIIQHCADKLASYLSVAPFVPNMHKEKHDYDEFNTREGIRVMGLAHTPTNEEASYGAIVNGEGEVTDFLKLEYLMLKRGQGFMSEKERKLREQDREKLKKFILHKKPHVIALGADTLVTRDLMEDLNAMVRELHDTEPFPLIPIEYVNSELSVVFMNSKRAHTEFLTYPPKLRQAVSLARRLHDPLCEFAQLCTADEEILCLKFHPLQDSVPREQLLDALYAEFVNQVNEVGVDINKCILNPYLTPLVQFIGGLGPRKGAYLIRTLKKQQTSLLENRTQLVQNCNIGKTVFINCAGFIKIDTNSFSDSASDTYIEVLDSTRVHPEAYEWARKMAVDALDYEENDNNPAQALEEIIEKPEKLRDLDLDEFAKELKRQNLGLKKQTLYDIRNELTERYQDKRKPYCSPTDEEIFEMLTGENLTIFHVGKMVQVRVTGIVRRKPKPDQVEVAQPIRCETSLWKCPFCSKDDFAELGEVWNHFDTNLCPGQAFGVRCRLENGLSGTIPLKFLSDKEVIDPQTRVKVGMTINCRILKVLIDRFTVELTCRTSDLIDQNNRFRLPKDNYYDFESENKDLRTEEESKKKKNRQRTYMKRIIVHPSFYNIDFKKAEQILDAAPQGEPVIRPSSKGTDHLTLSWKVHNGIHQNVLIREENKSNAFSLGRQLFIDNESFEDLDEIIARYLQPMAAFARDLINFRYFRDLNGDRLAAEKLLSEEKQKAPSRIPYIVSASKEFPGKFLLSYQPNQKAFHEFITVTSEGYKYRNILFKSVSALFKWFKAHFNDRSTFPRTPGPQTPINASPYLAQQTSPFVGGVSSKQPGYVSAANLNPQAIQRAAASMSTHFLGSLTQAAGQAAAYNGSSFAAATTQPVPPSSYSMPPPRAANLYPTAGQSGHPAFGKTGMVPAASGSMPPPSMPIVQRPGSQSGNQWSEMMKQEQWQQQQQPARRMVSGAPLTTTIQQIKPRTPIYATPGASSQMSISPMQEETPNIKGDQTPLVDEWN